MAILKTRPTIRLMVPPVARPGQRCEVNVVFEARREVPVEFIDVSLKGEERVVIGAGNTQRTIRRPLALLKARLSDESKLPAGRSQRSCVFPLPAELPPSYRGKRAAADYTVTVHASIPWWPDAKREFVLAVSLPPTTTRDDGQRVHTTSVSGPKGEKPHVEFQLDSNVVLPGGKLSGQVALFNVAYNRYRVANLSLVAYEDLWTRAGTAAGRVEALRYAIVLDIERAKEGEPIPFTMKLPAALSPTWTTKLWTLGWFFELEAQIAWASNLTARVPVTVLPTGSTRKRKQRYAAPTIGTERVAAVWRRVAAAAGLEYDAESQCLRGRVGDLSVVLDRDHRGAEGIFLTAELRYPSLHIDLDGGRASGLRRVLQGGVKLGHARWDKRHYLTGREEAQVLSFGRNLGPALTSQRVADIDDEHVVVEVLDSGQSFTVLQRFAQAALALGRAIPEARAVIPPPAAMAEAVPAWERLAKGLRARLDRTRMAVQGHHEGSAAAVATEWSPKGHALRTTITFWTPDAVAERHQLAWSGGKIVHGLCDELPGPARDRLERLLVGAEALTIDSDRLVLWDPAPQLVTEPIVQRLTQLAALAAALRGDHGPYR